MQTSQKRKLEKSVKFTKYLKILKMNDKTSKTPNNSGDGLTIDGDHFKILINNENQHSLWPALKTTPNGWAEVGFSGSKQECTKYVDDNWKDMRPKSLTAQS